jgi:hypothetical protein
MQKPERGEAGTTALDPENAWRFSEEGCLRQFVSQIALDKNEYPDTSMLRHVEPIKRYLSQLRTKAETDETPCDAERTSLFTQTPKATSKAIRSGFVQFKRANPNLNRFTCSRWLGVNHLAAPATKLFSGFPIGQIRHAAFIGSVTGESYEQAPRSEAHLLPCRTLYRVLVEGNKRAGDSSLILPGH